MTENTITGSEAGNNAGGLVDLSFLFGINPGPEPRKLDLWKTIGDPKKVLETYYSEGNFYHHNNLQELATLAKVAPSTVRDTLVRFRKRDQIAGKYVPPPPKQLFEFSEEQKQILLDAFEQCEYIDSPGAQELALITELTTRQITNWFCNQRRKVDGKGDFEREKRSLIKKERQAQGLMRSSPFSAETLEFLEREYERLKNVKDDQGRPAPIPYGVLAEKTGINRKKISDWFSKRKIREKRQTSIKGNTEKTEANTGQQQILPSLMGRLSDAYRNQSRQPQPFSHFQLFETAEIETENRRKMTDGTPIGPETETHQRALADLSMLFGTNPGPEPIKLDLWKQIGDPTKVLHTYYSEGNFYYDNNNLQELATLAKVAPNTVQNTLARFRSQDRKSGKYVPPPPKQSKEYSEEQKRALLNAFEQCQYVDPQGVQELAQITNLTRKQITIWFCNQRQWVDKKGYIEREKRSLITKERQDKGLMRKASAFSPEVAKILELEFEKLKDSQGKRAKIPYDMLERTTGIDRTKIIAWFSRRKNKAKRQSVIKESLEETEATASHIGQLSSDTAQSPDTD